MDNHLAQIRAAAVDGRAHNVFYRQTQLERLCKVLIAHTTEIQDAITTDSASPVAEAATEISLAIAAVKRDYAALRPKRSQEEEYLIAANKDAPHQSEPAGIVYIEPTHHTLFYSAVVPLSAAIAAGNCVVLLLENNLRALSGLLRRLLPSALEADTFAIVLSPVQDRSLLDKAVLVDQNSDEHLPKANQLLSLPRSRTIAVIDRTGDVALAARELVCARFSFGGSSTYAPDVVLVNEFVKQDFIRAVVTECAAIGSGVVANGAISKGKANPSSRTEESLQKLRQADPDLRVLLQESKMAVVDLVTRSEKQLAQKVNAPVLIIHAIRSLDDAIDMASRTAEQPCLATFLFANLASAKYLAQFVDSSVSFVNHVPREILVGPAFPTGHAVNPVERYPVGLFTKARPAFVRPQTGMSSRLIAVLSSPSDTTARKAMLSEATTPLAAMKRSQGGDLGFFEQAILTGASVVLLSILSISGGGVYWYFTSGRRLW